MRFTRFGSAGLAVAICLTAGCPSVGPRKPLETVISEAEAGRPGALKELISRFGHPDPDAVQRAWEAVVGIGAPATDGLIQALKSGDRSVSEHAAAALGANRAREAVEGLSAALEREGFRKYVAAWALGEIGDPVSIAALVGALGDEDGETRKYAVRALIKFGSEAVPSLVEALESQAPLVRRYAVRGLGEIRDPTAAGPLLAVEGKIDRQVFLWALGRLGDPRGYPLIAPAAGDPDWRIRLAAVQALGDLGDEHAVPELTLTLDDEEWIVREWSARGLESLTGNRHTYRDQKGEDVHPYNLYR